MKSDCGGIGRFAPLLLASLLLHLAVIMMATTNAAKQYVSPSMVVEYLDRASHPGDPPHQKLQQVTPKPPERSATHSAATMPAPAPVAEPAVLTHKPMGEVTATVNRTPAENRGVRSGRDAVASPAGAVPGSGSQQQVPAGPESIQRTSDAAASAQRDSLQRRTSYQAEIKKLIEAHKEYPLAARRSGREGSCQRRFILGRNGTLKNVEVLTSCGHPFLDQAATSAITSVGKFPPLPDDFKGVEEAFAITIKFTLSQLSQQ